MEPAVAELYLEGVDAVEQVAARCSESEWVEVACGTWSAAETARHLLVVSRWYGEWLDRAGQGRSDPPFSERELAARNRIAVDELAAVAPDEAVERFIATARSYAGRVADQPDLAYGYPFGTVTAGLHLGVAATEWHLHAWDLSGVAGPRHEPSDPSGLFLAAGACVAEAAGGVRGRLLARLVPLGARRAPWETIRKRSGRAG